jgi:hypothetical protein
MLPIRPGHTENKINEIASLISTKSRGINIQMNVEAKRLFLKLRFRAALFALKDNRLARIQPCAAIDGVNDDGWKTPFAWFAHGLVLIFGITLRIVYHITTQDSMNVLLLPLTIQ